MSNALMSRTAVNRASALWAVAGFAAACVLALVFWVVRDEPASLARSFTSTCSGANVTGTIWIDNAGVFVSVVVVDPRDPAWEVQWPTFSDAVPGGPMTPTRGADYTGSILTTTQMLSDTDDGTTRTAAVRPGGQAAWCRLTMQGK